MSASIATAAATGNLANSACGCATVISSDNGDGPFVSADIGVCDFWQRMDFANSDSEHASPREWCFFEDPRVHGKLSDPIRCSFACVLHAKQNPVGAYQPPPPSPSFHPYDDEPPPAPHTYNMHQRRVDTIMEGARAELLRAKNAAATAPLNINAKRELTLATQNLKRAHSLLIQSI